MNTNAPVTAIDGLPEVLFADELAHVLRIPLESFQRSQEAGVLEWPALPVMDERRRYSRRVLLWFLLQHPPDWESYRRQFTSQDRVLRRTGQRWYEMAAPFTSPFIAAARPGEPLEISLSELARTLRATEATLEAALGRQDFPLPPAQSPPPKWTRGQIERFLGPPVVARQARS